MLVDNKSHVPDILDCIANLSSDEVFTPPEVANQVLDLLPKEIWSDPNIKILDPCCKTGIFLRESARRLMVGLEKAIPNEEERREHIFKKMLYGIAITELTGLVSRRSLYYSKDASSDYSIVQFKDKEGNITYKRTEHDYVQGKCRICGSPYENLERGDSMENYAYQFIHEGEVFNMKFDVIIGNPPYQLQDGGGGRGSSAIPIYQIFVEQAFRLKPRYVSMITPSRWFTDGKGLQEFRTKMLESTNFRNLVDYPDSGDIFPSVEIKGGVSYFLWDSKYEGACQVSRVEKGVTVSTSQRFLGEHEDVFVRLNEAIPIIAKVKSKSEPTLEGNISSRKPFGMPSPFHDFEKVEKKGYLKLYQQGSVTWVDPKYVLTNTDWIPKWKVLVSKAYGAGEGYPHQIIGKPIVAEPNSVCTETYLVCGVFDNKKQAENFASYMSTKFFRFLVGVLKATQNMTKDKFKLVPNLDVNTLWTDDILFKRYGIDTSEIEFINSIVRDMREDS